MLWGSMNSNGYGMIEFIDEYYDKRDLPQLIFFRIGLHLLFQQNDRISYRTDPKHTEKVAQEYFKKK